MYTLNIENWNYYGPMAYNEDVKKFIEENGKKIETNGFNEKDKDLKYPKFSKSMTLLHVPSGKISSYDSYVEYEGEKLLIFDGFAFPTVDYNQDEILFIFSEDINKDNIKTETTSFNNEEIHLEFKRLKKEKFTVNYLLNKLEKFSLALTNIDK